MYQPRVYRHSVSSAGLTTFNACVKETDLFISAASDFPKEARRLILEARGAIEDYIKKNPVFLRTLKPLQVPPDAHFLVREMAEAAASAGVGPMAAVAGAVAGYVGRGLAQLSETVIVENGGDIFIQSPADRVVGIYAGHSPLSGKIGLKIEGGHTPLGVCTSSGTVGHSLSFGAADAVVIISSQAALADAVATATGNIIQNVADIDDGIKFARSVDGVSGVLIIKEDKLGAWGDVNICRLG
jgi:ApbE superfamily uncharacterized protein (UPF0280 family)